MKTFLLLGFAFTTAVGQFAHAANPEDQDQVKPTKKQQQAPSNRQLAPTQAPKTQRSATVPRQMPVNRGPQSNPVRPKQMPKVHPYVDQDQVRPTRPLKSPDMMPRVRPSQNVVTTPRTITPVPPNVDPRKRSDWDNRNRTNRNNWQNRVTSNNNSWEEARRRHHHNHHHRDWWRSRYSRFALFGSGYYFWDNGYWFPAYGYDPAYNRYSYDEPIYGYNDLEPAQVIASVQTELQRLGYYRYAVDGEMGPATRAAIANYQRDTGLSITSAIDEPTLQSLGLD
jgi:Putative peptidoglycan binding domain